MKKGFLFRTDLNPSLLLEEFNSGSTLIDLGKRYNANYKTIRKFILMHYPNFDFLKKFNEDYFTNVDTEEKAYWLGFIFADGCIYKKTQNSHSLIIKLVNKDREHLEKFKGAIDSKIKVYDLLSHNCSSITLSSRKLVSDLENLGCVERKSLIIRFPNISEKMEKFFIRGFFDGDGHVGIIRKDYYRADFYSGSESFLESIGRIFVKNNLLSKYIIRKDKRHECRFLKFSCSKAFSVLNWMYAGSNIYLERKYKTYLEACKKYGHV